MPEMHSRTVLLLCYIRPRRCLYNDGLVGPVMLSLGILKQCTYFWGEIKLLAVHFEEYEILTVLGTGT